MLGASVGPTEALPLVAAVQVILVRMHDELTFRFSTPYDYHQRVQYVFLDKSRAPLQSTARPLSGYPAPLRYASAALLVSGSHFWLPVNYGHAARCYLI